MLSKSNFGEHFGKFNLIIYLPISLPGLGPSFEASNQIHELKNVKADLRKKLTKGTLYIIVHFN